jgi:hypothetical protein
MHRFLMAVALLAACGGGQASTPSTVVANDRPVDAASGECAAVAPTISKTYKSRPNLAPGKLDAAISKHCVDDEWNRSLRSCLRASASERDSNRCTHQHMTRDQESKLSAALEPFVVSAFEEAMAAMHEFADKMCACKDSQCAEHVSDEMTKWSQEMSRRHNEMPRMTEKDTQEAAAIGERMGRCMQAAMSGSASAPSP